MHLTQKGVELVEAHLRVGVVAHLGARSVAQGLLHVDIDPILGEGVPVLQGDKVQDCVAGVDVAHRCLLFLDHLLLGDVVEVAIVGLPHAENGASKVVVELGRLHIQKRRK